MNQESAFERGSARTFALASLGLAAIVVALASLAVPLRRFIRESAMRHATSAHCEVLFPSGAAPQDAMTQFATQRDFLFTALDQKLGNAAASAKIRIVFDPDFSPRAAGETPEAAYSVSGTKIHARLDGPVPQLPPAADAEALLHAAWGDPGNKQIARWTAIWLAGDWGGMGIGMGAAQLEQRLGHQKLATVLGAPPGEISSSEDEALGAAWISEVAELAGVGDVRKLYVAKMPRPTVAEVTRVLGSSPLELERRWQMWMYAYLAGMPASPGQSGMSMPMPMAAEHSGKP